ncbi:MAG: hypothetical protein OEO84_07070 [Betaproteobacteria bacterium]|nr:hypothetical protein [Betaproteobacteria bacterium]
MQRILVLFLAACFGALAMAGTADARGGHGHGRVHLGVVIGGPLWWGYSPWRYYPPYERVIVERPNPTVYVEKDAVGDERDADQYWYFCADSKTYYPYVKQCASPWQRVVPHSPQE